MPVEATDVQAAVETPAPETPEAAPEAVAETPEAAPADAAPAEEAEGAAEEEPVVATPAPKKRGRPAGAKNKNPRKRPIIEEEIQETPKKDEKTPKKVPKKVVAVLPESEKDDYSDSEDSEPQYVAAAKSADAAARTLEAV